MIASMFRKMGILIVRRLLYYEIIYYVVHRQANIQIKTNTLSTLCAHLLSDNFIK